MAIKKRATKPKGLPTNYTAHDGKGYPVPEDEYVVVVVRTGEGLAFSGPTKARYHEWDNSKHKGGLGAIVGYKLAARDEQIDSFHRWPE